MKIIVGQDQLQQWALKPMSNFLLPVPLRRVHSGERRSSQTVFTYMNHVSIYLDLLSK